MPCLCSPAGQQTVTNHLVEAEGKKSLSAFSSVALRGVFYRPGVHHHETPARLYEGRNNLGPPGSAGGWGRDRGEGEGEAEVVVRLEGVTIASCKFPRKFGDFPN